MKKNVLNIITLTLVLCLLLTASAHASATPGSAADPLVSQHYVDTKFEQLLAEYTDLLNSFRTGASVQLTEHQLNLIVNDVIKTLDSRSLAQLPGTAYTPVHALAGQTIIGGEGTEIILRSGISTAWVHGPNGLSDVTTGSEVMGNEQIRQNHLLIVPRADGRGVRAVTECWFLIKGTYTITH